MISLKEQLGSERKQINSKRIENFLKLLKAESKKFIENSENGKNDFRKYQMELESLLDVSPTSSTDLSSKLSSINVAELMGKNKFSFSKDVGLCENHRKKSGIA